MGTHHANVLQELLLSGLLCDSIIYECRESISCDRGVLTEDASLYRVQLLVSEEEIVTVPTRAKGFREAVVR